VERTATGLAGGKQTPAEVTVRILEWGTAHLRGPWVEGVGGILLMAVCGPVAAAQTVEGFVREKVSFVVITGADVTLTNQANGTVVRAVSDETGRFSLDIPEAGLYRVGAARLGYEPFESDPFFVDAGQNVSADLFLKVRPIELKPLDVVTDGTVRKLSLAGFYRRMERGIGHFLVREDIEVLDANRVTDLFRQIPGVQVVVDVAQGTGDVIMRGGRSTFTRIGETPQVCYPSITIDGQLVRAGGQQPANWSDVQKSPRQVGTWGELLRPDDVEAVEVYAGGAGLPAQVAGNVSPCGAILFWTRN
jgi:hypothetical protein